MLITTTGAYWRYPRFLPPSPNSAAAKGRRRAKRHVNRRARRIVRQGLLQIVIGTLDGAGDLPGIDDISIFSLSGRINAAPLTGAAKSLPCERSNHGDRIINHD